jgi:hypothetical protein
LFYLTKQKTKNNKIFAGSPIEIARKLGLAEMIRVLEEFKPVPKDELVIVKDADVMVIQPRYNEGWFLIVFFDV